MNCPNCGVPLMGGMIICPKCKFDTRTKDGGDSFREYKNRIQNQKAKEEADALREKNRKLLREKIIMTTCPSVEGYRIKRQCGLVFGEVIFKTGVFKSFGALLENTLDNMVSNVTLSDTELSGTTGLISNAREYAIKKMKDEAIDRDANAIIGVQTESTVGGELLHITICGTAVEVEASNAE